MAITTNCLMFDNQQLLYDGTGILYNEDPLNPLNLPPYTIRLLYRDEQASTQAIPPTNHAVAFWHCGKNTVTGAAELAQIPNDWK